jgi:hypothetical protein
VTNVGDADSMLRFWLERGDDGMKHCWKMKRIQRARLSMGRKRDTALRCGDVGRRRGGTGGGEGGDNASWDDTNLTVSKNEENSRSRFSCYKWTVKI